MTTPPPPMDVPLPPFMDGHRNDEEVTSAFSEVETKKATIKLLR